MLERLPVEVITSILEYLSVSDLLEVSTVCRRCLLASQSRSLSARLSLVLCPGDLFGPGADEAEDRPLVRRATSLRLHSDVSARVLCQPRFHACLHQLESLSFRGSSIQEDELCSVLRHCVFLRELDLANCNALFMSGTFLEKHERVGACLPVLSALHSLDVSHNRYLSDALLTRVMATVARPRSLRLAGCTICFSSYSDSSASFSTLLSLKTILLCVSEHTCSLRVLDLSATGIPDSALARIGQIPALQLEQLYLADCDQVSVRGLEALLRSQTSLQVLDVHGCPGVDEQTVAVLSSACPGVRWLDLSGCRLTSSVLAPLGSLPCLERVQLANCFREARVDTTSLARFVAAASHVRCVDLSSASIVDDSVVSSLCAWLPLLTELNLSSSSHVTDESVHLIASGLSQLSVLRLAWCRQLTDFGLVGLDKTARFVEALAANREFTACRCCTSGRDKLTLFRREKSLVGHPLAHVAQHEVNALLRAGASGERGLQRLSKLRLLDLSSCPLVSDAGVEHGLPRGQLQHLLLSACTLLTDRGLEALSANAPVLERLSLQHCCHVTDRGLAQLIRHAPRLHWLNIAGCSAVTDRTVDALLTWPHRLRYLDASMGTAMSPQGVALLEERIPALLQPEGE